MSLDLRTLHAVQARLYSDYTRLFSELEEPEDKLCAQNGLTFAVAVVDQLFNEELDRMIQAARTEVPTHAT